MTDDENIAELGERMAAALARGDVAGAETLRAQWSYAIELRDFFKVHPGLREDE